MRVITTVVLFFILAPASAGELIYSYVDNEGDHYYLHLDMRVNGNSKTIYRILTDFNNLTAVNDTVVVSKLLKTEDKVHTVLTESEGCIWFFCKRVKQVSRVSELDNGFLMSVTVPEQSDLKYGRTLWEIIDEGKTTRIKYNADYVPDFWVPPLFGPAIFKKRMLKEGQKTINGIEKLASENNNNNDIF
jgi:hypothetical protein